LKVLKRLGRALTVLALLCAIGAHWLVFQSFAWTTMLAGNLRHGSLSQAVERTFNGEHPCALCKQISRSKQAEKKTEFNPELKKFEFSFTSNIFIFLPPSQFYEARVPGTEFYTLTHAPPVPPPRRFLG
jgi:hypothetical protein